MPGTPRTLFIVTVVVAASLRLVFAPFTGHSWDMYVWFKSGEMFVAGDINVYGVEEIEGFPWGFYSYPPVWLYWIALVKYLTSALGLSINYFALLVKVPIIAADLCIGALMFAMTKRLNINQTSGLLISAAYLLNPVSVFISGVWGMFDSVAAALALLGLYLLINNRFTLAPVCLGIGGAVKLFPFLLAPVMLFYMRANGKLDYPRLASFSLLLTSPIVISSIPYVPFLGDYLSKLLFHTANIGQFTYWALIAPLTGSRAASVVALASMSIVMLALLYRSRNRVRDVGSLLYYSLAVLLVFLGLSPKVNVQYLIWVLPLLLMGIRSYGKQVNVWLMVTVQLNVAGAVFLMSSVTQVGYSLTNIGSVNSYGIEPNPVFWYFLLGSAGVAGAGFLMMTLQILGVREISKSVVGRSGITLILVALILGLFYFPAPTGIKLPEVYPRILVVDGIDTLLMSREGSWVETIEENYAVPTHVVILLSLDFYNTYRGYVANDTLNSYIRYKLDARRWTQYDLMGIVKESKSRGLQVLIGVLLAPEQRYVNYGIHGYRSTWLIENHRYLIDPSGRVNFSALMTGESKLTYAEYLSRKVLRVVEDFGFDGVFVSTRPEGIGDGEAVRNVNALLGHLRQALGPSRTLVVDGVSPLLEPGDIRSLLRNSDFVTLATSPWLASRNDPLSNTTEIGYYRTRIEMLMDSVGPGNSYRVLQSIYTFDFVEGWVVPALELKLELEGLRPPMNSGYVIYYGTVVSPYRLVLGR
ncbi:MAG: hypothetical protein NZ920_04565 [Aigarchaeota archaeon]|nr:hypothetical protein [Aigarchaeota archaeon]MDW8093211.1 hypothetical protein [Nitrososphaerota archaeon]